MSSRTSSRTSARAATPVPAPITPRLIDPRGPRFGAGITVVVLALAFLLIPSAPVAAGLLLTAQALAFGLGSVIGVHAQPYGVLFRLVVRPRLAPPAHLEDARPPRFAQGVGLAFAVVALGALVAGSPVVALAATGAALAAAFLNAAFDFCLGCEMYLLIARVRDRAAQATASRVATMSVELRDEVSA